MVTDIKRMEEKAKHRHRERERKRQTEVHLFDTESLRKCRGMSRTPVCAWLCVFVH